MIKFRHNGFSLIELMIVVAIVAVLAIVAIPAYRTYINKAHLSEIFSTIKQDQDNIVTYTSTNNLPINATDATTMLSNIGGLAVCNSNYVSTTAGDCIFSKYGIHVVTNTALLPYMVINFTPTSDTNKLIKWVCSYETTTVADGMSILPIMCKQPSTSITALW